MCKTINNIVLVFINEFNKVDKIYLKNMKSERMRSFKEKGKMPFSLKNVKTEYCICNGISSTLYFREINHKFK